MKRIYEPYKGFASYFLMQPVQLEEIKELKILALEFLNLVNFNNQNKKFKEVFTGIIDEKDGLYKEITVNLKNKSVVISSCQELKDDYFISKKLIYVNNNDIKYYETLVKKESPNSIYREIVTKGWKYGEDYTAIKICSENYTEDIPVYSIQELRNSKNHYSKCLSKNKK